MSDFQDIQEKKLKTKHKYKSGLTTISPFPDRFVKFYTCNLLHSKVPKKTEEGIKWVCKEGCDE